MTARSTICTGDTKVLSDGKTRYPLTINKGKAYPYYSERERARAAKRLLNASKAELSSTD